MTMDTQVRTLVRSIGADFDRSPAGFASPRRMTSPNKRGSGARSHERLAAGEPIHLRFDRPAATGWRSRSEHELGSETRASGPGVGTRTWAPCPNESRAGARIVALKTAPSPHKRTTLHRSRSALADWFLFGDPQRVHTWVVQQFDAATRGGMTPASALLCGSIGGGRLVRAIGRDALQAL